MVGKAMSKHTPGPWFAIRNDHYWEVNIEDCRYAPSVANTCDTEVREGSYIAEANARLIAAAPDLLEALELADAVLRGANMNMVVVEAKVKAAIATAKGES